MKQKPETRNSTLILAGDIGGTKTLLALADPASGAVLFERCYASRDYGNFSDLLRAFLKESGDGEKVDRACLAVAGPVEANRSQVTYLPWLIDGATLAQAFDIGQVQVHNDFVAAAQGIATLAPHDLVALQTGCPVHAAARVVIGAGTGLGVAGLLRQGDDSLTVPGEGGHIGFAPSDEEQLALWRHLHQRHGRATAERVLSGAGLTEIYRFLLAQGGAGDTPDPLQAEDTAAAIGNLAGSQAASLSAGAVALFARIYGAYAGDLALLFMARGGVYLAGGIAPKLLPELAAGGFMTAFRTKAEHARLMGDFPVHVVVNERLGLLGAIRIARKR